MRTNAINYVVIVVVGFVVLLFFAVLRSETHFGETQETILSRKFQADHKTHSSEE